MSRQTELSGGATARVRVVAGILQDDDGRILIADRTRSHSLKDHWEFPGGKVDGDETAEAALKRELVEELGIEISQIRHFRHIEHDYPKLSVAIDFFLVAEWQGTPAGREGQRIRWVDRVTLGGEMLLPADAPVIEALQGLQPGSGPA